MPGRMKGNSSRLVMARLEFELPKRVFQKILTHDGFDFGLNSRSKAVLKHMRIDTR